eukprot:4422286-Amphidinium_carterae.1
MCYLMCAARSVCSIGCAVVVELVFLVEEAYDSCYECTTSMDKSSVTQGCVAPLVLHWTCYVHRFDLCPIFTEIILAAGCVALVPREGMRFRLVQCFMTHVALFHCSCTSDVSPCPRPNVHDIVCGSVLQQSVDTSVAYIRLPQLAMSRIKITGFRASATPPLRSSSDTSSDARSSSGALPQLS